MSARNRKQQSVSQPLNFRFVQSNLTHFPVILGLRVLCWFHFTCLTVSRVISASSTLPGQYPKRQTSMKFAFCENEGHILPPF